jgi:CspA family cold shock protein
MTKGQIKWFDPKKGYGFIVGPEGQDVFVHYSQIRVEGFKTLNDNQCVEYELVESDKGWQARDVKPVVEAPRDEPAATDEEPAEPVSPPSSSPSPPPESESASGYEGSSSGYEGASEA